MLKSFEECEAISQFIFAEDDKEKYQKISKFHKALWSEVKSINDMTIELLDEYSEMHQIRTKKQNEKYFDTLKIILCNVVRAHRSNKRYITISLNKQEYSNTILKYEPVHITYTIFTNLINWLIDTDYICLYKATNNPSSGQASMIEPLESLATLIDDFCIGYNDVIRHPDYVPLQIRSDNKILIDYEDTEETIYRNNILNRYNYHLGSKKIMINDKLISKPINIYSIFNGEEGRNGRIYGGEWINCPSQDRASIKIDNKPTVELDIATCSLRMAAHLNNKDVPNEIDLYAIQGIDRNLVKLISNSMLNMKDSTPKQGCSHTTNSIFNKFVDTATKKEAKRQWITDKEINTKQIFSKISSYSNNLEELKKYDIHYTKKMLREAVERVYNYFSLFAYGWLFEGRGLELQYLDSKVCFKVIDKFLSLNKTVLTIHDSYIVIEDDKQLLIDTIESCYYDVIGYKPKLK